MLALVNWAALAAFAGAVLAATLFVLAASGHFPAEHRAAAMRSGLGPLVLWGSMAVVAGAAGLALLTSLGRQPWPAVVIAAGAAILVAPLLLQHLPDAFVDGRRGLLAGAAACAVLAALQIAAA